MGEYVNPICKIKNRECMYLVNNKCMIYFYPDKRCEDIEIKG